MEARPILSQLPRPRGCLLLHTYRPSERSPLVSRLAAPLPAAQDVYVLRGKNVAFIRYAFRASAEFAK